MTYSAPPDNGANTTETAFNKIKTGTDQALSPTHQAIASSPIH